LAFCAARPVLLNWTCGGVALLGLIVQVAIERRRRRRKRDEDEDDEDERRSRGWILRWFVKEPKKKSRWAA
jgi:hypothetical protein